MKIQISFGMFSPGSSSSFFTPFISTNNNTITHSLKDVPLHRSCSVLEGTLSAFVCISIGFMCKLTIQLNNFKVINGHNLKNAIENARVSKERGVITASNHISALDDPLGLLSLVPMKDIINCSSHLRWTLGAKDILFTNKYNSRFFTLGQCVSITRGGGLYQPAIEKAASILNESKWVHIFPEGRVKLDSGLDLLPMKPGVGRIVLTSDKVPTIIPIYFSGMRQLFTDSGFPKFGKTITVVVGEPVNIDDILKEYYSMDKEEKTVNEKRIFVAIAERIGEDIFKLSKLVEDDDLSKDV